MAKAIKMDKKQTGKGITAVLLNDDYQLNVYNDVTNEELILAFNYLKNHFL